MKKGCFLTTVVSGTILIGIIFYIGEKHGDKIVDFFKGRVVELTSESADDYFEQLVQSEYKDSLKVLWKDVYDKAKLMEFEDGLNYMSGVLLKMERFTKDSLISADEFNAIKTYMENESK